MMTAFKPDMIRAQQSEAPDWQHEFSNKSKEIFMGDRDPDLST